MASFTKAYLSLWNWGWFCEAKSLMHINESHKTPGCCTYMPQPKGLHECSPEVLPFPSSEGYFHAIFA